MADANLPTAGDLARHVHRLDEAVRHQQAAIATIGEALQELEALLAGHQQVLELIGKQLAAADRDAVNGRYTSTPQ
jgi:hypothetical protein